MSEMKRERGARWKYELRARMEPPLKEVEKKTILRPKNILIKTSRLVIKVRGALSRPQSG